MGPLTTSNTLARHCVCSHVLVIINGVNLKHNVVSVSSMAPSPFSTYDFVILLCQEKQDDKNNHEKRKTIRIFHYLQLSCHPHNFHSNIDNRRCSSQLLVEISQTANQWQNKQQIPWSNLPTV